MRSSVAASSATSGTFGGNASSSSNGSTSDGPSSSRTNSAGAATLAAADDDDDFGAFAAAAPALSPPATSDYHSNIFGASSSAPSLMPSPPPNPLSASSVSAFSQSGLSELSFADDDYDSPFADIVNEPPKSANASRTNSFSHSGNDTSGMTFALLPQQQQQQSTMTRAGARGIEMGSPLLSFSPVATPSTLSMAPSASSLPADIFSSSTNSAASVDVFSLSASSVPSVPAEAELLSFSPLALPSSAPSAAPALSSFLLDAPSPSVSADLSKPAPRFSLPPPRTTTMPSHSSGAVNSTKAASFSGQVSVGELLSFSPVASAPVSSFSDSIGSSAAATASIFGDDDLFSLSTADLDFSTTPAVAPAAVLDPVDALVGSPSPELSPASFGESMIQDFTVGQSSASLRTTSPSAAEEERDEGTGTLIPESEAQVVEAEDEFVIQEPQENEERLQQQSPASSELEVSAEEAFNAEFEELQQSVSDNGSSAADDDESGDVPVAKNTVEAAHDAQRLSIPSPVGYSQFDFITQGFSPVASQLDEQAGSAFDARTADEDRDNDDALARDLSTSSDADQYQPFSQDSVGDQYTSLGDLSEGEFGGYSASPAQSQESKRHHELRSTPGGSEAARTPTGQADGSEVLEYASFSSSGSNEQALRFDVEANGEDQQDGAVGGSTASTSPTISGAADSEAAGFGSFEAVDGGAPQDDDFDDFGAPSSVATASQGAFSGFQAPANTVSEASGGDTDEFGGFGAAPTSELKTNLLQSTSATSFSAIVGTSDEFGGFSSGSFGGDTADDFGDFGQSSSALLDGGDDDDFGDFGQNLNGAGDDDDDDFGDFGQSSSAGGDDDAFGGFGQSSSSDFGGSTQFSSGDDNFGDFNSPPPASATPSSFVPVTMAPSITTPPSSKQELDNFFHQAFAVHSAPTPLDTSLHAPVLPSQTSKELFQDKVCISFMQIAVHYFCISCFTTGCHCFFFLCDSMDDPMSWSRRSIEPLWRATSRIRLLQSVRRSLAPNSTRWS